MSSLSLSLSLSLSPSMAPYIYVRNDCFFTKQETPKELPKSCFLKHVASSSKRVMSHIAVERNRRRQMNDHLKVLRTLTPCFYIKRGDQASIIGGVIEFIKELHMILQSLESKKRRKSLSPSPVPSPKTLLPTPHSIDSPFGFENIKELAASCNSPIADVEAKISGANLILRTVSKRIPGQVVKIISVLEKLSFEILHLNISSMEDTVLYSFVIKIGLECQLSVEELVVEVQQSFHSEGVIAKNST